MLPGPRRAGIAGGAILWCLQICACEKSRVVRLPRVHRGSARDHMPIILNRPEPPTIIIQSHDQEIVQQLKEINERLADDDPREDAHKVANLWSSREGLH